MFDTHCHLNFSRFKDRVDAVITDARAQGVTHILVPGTDLATSQKAVEIADQYKNVYAAVGIHPHHVFALHLPGARNSHPGGDVDGIKALLQVLR